MEQNFEKLPRPTVETMDQILGEPFKVLDDGFIRVIDYMGNDTAIVQAARVSYGAGTKKMTQDRELIRYLLRHYHTSPFEMCEIKLHIRVPMDCWRQWIRHRTANVNEYSTRYSIAIDSAQATNPDQWRLQAKSNRQGSEGFMELDSGKGMTEQEQQLQNLARQTYQSRIDAGIAREQARKDLPLSTYTEAYWKIDLHNLLRFLRLRMDTHAQYEIRLYAETIGKEIISRWCPMVWEAFQEYRMESLSLSGRESDMIKLITSGQMETVVQMAQDQGWLKEKDGKLRMNLERMEFESKLERLGLKIPW